MQNKLLPCPFCGGEAKYIEDKDFFISRFVTCTKCGIETRRNYLRKDYAIKDWNTRKPMERIVEQLEEELELAEKQKEECTFKGLPYYDRTEGYIVATSNAIEIVKGGVDNATN